MGVSTHGILNKEITAKQIFDVVVSKFDKEAQFNITVDKYNNNESGSIFFKDTKDSRELFYCIVGDKEEGTQYEDGLEHVSLSLGNWNNSVKIMTEIIKVFGGYIDGNDCDEIGAYYISKDGNFQYDEYVTRRNKIIDVLTEELSEQYKIRIANEILKHKIEIKELI